MAVCPKVRSWVQRAAGAEDLEVADQAVEEEKYAVQDVEGPAAVAGWQCEAVMAQVGMRRE
ncbi:hypothetical protein E5D57_012052 [Metarhizium anisopliae]|nr:hypothetical protein E5D57_012052 [Metarhizium anisopliae]